MGKDRGGQGDRRRAANTRGVGSFASRAMRSKLGRAMAARQASSMPSMRWVCVAGSLLILAGFAGLGWQSHQAMKQRIDRRIHDLAEARETTFKTALAWMGNTLEQEATLIAADPRVRTLMIEGRDAVLAEGGGAGGEKAAAVRAELLEATRPAWSVMADRFDARQLHFHVTPGDTSFLRVHAPDRFGDDLSAVRHTIDSVLRTGRPARGFESGRVVSGVRGVVPIHGEPDASGARPIIGALEAGASLKTTLDIVQQTTGADYAVLLRLDHLERTMWPEKLAAWQADQAALGRYMVEQATDVGEQQLLECVAGEPGRACGPQLRRIDRRAYAFQCFAFRDFRGSRDADLPPVGKVVVWSDAQAIVGPIRAQANQTIKAYAVAAPVMIGLMVGLVALGQRKLRDVISRRTEALQRSRQMFQQVINSLPEYVFWKDEHGVYQGCNDRFAAAMGLTQASSIAGHTDQTLPWDPAYVEQFRSLDLEAMGEAGMSTAEEPLWAEAPGAAPDAIGRTRRLPLRGPDGQTVGVLVAIEDITEQRRLAGELERERTLLRTLMETTPDLIFAKDENGVYIAANLAFSAFVGVGEREIVGRTDFDLFPPEVAQWFIDHDRAAMIDEMPSQNEEWVRYPDGELVLLDTLKTPTNIFGYGPGIVGVARDITQRRRSEEALRENERRLSDIINATGEFIWETDLAGRFTYVGGRVQKVLGYEPWQIMGKTPSDLMPEEDKAAGEGFYSHSCESPSTFRNRHVRQFDRSGRLRWLSVTGTPVFDGEGKLTGYRGAAADVTERRETEDQLRKLSLIASRTDNGVVITDARGRVEWVNDGFTRITGYAFDEVRGKNPGAVLQGPDTDPAAVARIGEALAARAGFHEELINYHKSGQPYWVEVEVEPLFDEDGVLRNYMGIQRDVTERRRREDELRRVQQLLTDAIAAIDSGMALYDDSDRLVVFNDAYEAFCTGETGAFRPGMSHQEVLRRCIECNAIDDMPCERWTELRREAHRSRSEARDMRLRGRWIRVSDRSMSDGGVVTLLTDIDQMKRTQTELEMARDEAEAAGRAKSQFLANISHELRTPLTAILGYADLLADPQMPAGDQRNFVQTIRRNGKHLLTVINDLLDLSRIDAGRLELERRPFDVVELIDDVVELMQVRATAKSLPLRAEVADAARGRFVSDPSRLRQILLNLVGNAVKFTDAGEVGIDVSMTESRAGRRELTIRVVDTGVGVDPVQIHALFEPFVQADASTSRQFGGTGLGLAISKNLARALGGDLLATSQPGAGSIFNVWVPVEAVEDEQAGAEGTFGDSTDHGSRATAAGEGGVSDADDRAASAPPSKPEKLAGRVLLADDAADNRRMLEFILIKLGLSVETAEDGEIALETATEAWEAGRAFDVILMDMQMPRMDGYEATRRLRSAGYTKPILAVTAHAGPEQHKLSVEAGCDDVVTKPINLAQLTDALRECLASAAGA